MEQAPGSDTGPEQPNRLERALASAAQRMRADFDETASFQHAGSKGREREHLAVNFLEKYLPANISIAHGGEILDLTGDVSPECDVIVFDSSAPPLYSGDTHRIVPNECVFGTIEVKSHLDSGELRDALDKARKVKSMPKQAFRNYDVEAPDGRYRGEYYGRVWPYMPTCGFLFARSSIDLRTLAKSYIEHTKEWPIEQQLEGIFVLDKGIIMWTPRDGSHITSSPEPDYGLQVMLPERNTDHVLLWMSQVLHDYFSTASMPAKFDFNQYGGASSRMYAKYRIYADGVAVENIEDTNNVDP